MARLVYYFIRLGYTMNMKGIRKHLHLCWGLQHSNAGSTFMSYKLKVLLFCTSLASRTTSSAVFLNHSRDRDKQLLKSKKELLNHVFHLKWFEQYPHFQSYSFYISGESCARVYVLTLDYEFAKVNLKDI